MHCADLSNVTAAAVLENCRRRCALCFDQDFDLKVKAGWLTRIDPVQRAADKDNLVYLCRHHHQEAADPEGRGNGLTPSRLRRAKTELKKCIAEHHGRLIAMAAPPAADAPCPATAVDPELFDRRIPVYRAFYRFAAAITTGNRVTVDELFEYAAQIREALFLFDESLDRYLFRAYQQAARLRCLQRQMEDPDRYDTAQWLRLIDQETALIVWFDRQLAVGKRKFNRYLNITDPRTIAAPDQEDR